MPSLSQKKSLAFFSLSLSLSPEKEGQNDKWPLLNSFRVGTALLKEPLNGKAGCLSH